MLDVCLCVFISLYSEFSGEAALQHVTIPWCFHCEGGGDGESEKHDRVASCLFLPAACKSQIRL